MVRTLRQVVRGKEMPLQCVALFLIVAAGLVAVASTSVWSDVGVDRLAASRGDASIGGIREKAPVTVTVGDAAEDSPPVREPASSGVGDRKDVEADDVSAPLGHGVPQRGSPLSASERQVLEQHLVRMVDEYAKALDRIAGKSSSSLEDSVEEAHLIALLERQSMCIEMMNRGEYSIDAPSGGPRDKDVVHVNLGVRGDGGSRSVIFFVPREGAYGIAMREYHERRRLFLGEWSYQFNLLSYEERKTRIEEGGVPAGVRVDLSTYTVHVDR